MHSQFLPVQPVDLLRRQISRNGELIISDLIGCQRQSKAYDLQLLPEAHFVRSNSTKTLLPTDVK